AGSRASAVASTPNPAQSRTAPRQISPEQSSTSDSASLTSVGVMEGGASEMPSVRDDLIAQLERCDLDFHPFAEQGLRHLIEEFLPFGLRHCLQLQHGSTPGFDLRAR